MRCPSLAVGQCQTSDDSDGRWPTNSPSKLFKFWVTLGHRDPGPSPYDDDCTTRMTRRNGEAPTVASAHRSACESASCSARDSVVALQMWLGRVFARRYEAYLDAQASRLEHTGEVGTSLSASDSTSSVQQQALTLTAGLRVADPLLPSRVALVGVCSIPTRSLCTGVVCAW
jgi:hypothetical protein